jgi:hypothetical protein
MLNKAFYKIKSKVRKLLANPYFQKEFKYYQRKFECNGWVVKRSDESYVGPWLKIYYHDTLIAETTVTRDQKHDYIIDKVLIIQGYESLISEVNQVLRAATVEAEAKEKAEQDEKLALIKKAKSETRFLGPF